MRSSFKSVSTLVVTLILLGAGWAGYAQVQTKPPTKAAVPQKTAAPQKPAAPQRPAAPQNPAAPANAAPADPRATAKPAAPKPSEAAESDDEAVIRKGAEAFVTTYNAHDAKAVSELFALKAEFTDEDGNLIKGREAIEQDFAQMFTDNPECKIEVEIDSIRVLTPNIAVEEGTVRGKPVPDEAENVSSYIAVHVKVDGKWVLASVSDYEAESEDLSPRGHLEQLSWMVGDWIDEGPDSVLKSTCRWDNSGNYLLHEFYLQIAGEISASGSLRIGWDPLTGQIKSWTFDADSGYSEGLWSRDGDEWSVRAHGVSAEGKTTSSTNVFRYVDDDTMTWRSYDRVIGGESAEDVPEFVIKRQAPAPAE